MGSGSYLGGSTVVNVGWSWSGKSGLSKAKKKKEKPVNQDFRKIKRKVKKQKPNWITDDKINIKELTLLNARRRSLLQKIAKTTDIKNVRLSKNERIFFNVEIKQKDGLIKWAESQSQYKGIINRLKDKK